MIALLLLPPVLSVLVLAAHFLRTGDFLVVAALLALIPLLFVRARWVVRVAVGTLWLGSAVWVYTAARFTLERLRFGMPWLRMVLILGGVAAFTALSSLVFRTVRLREWYRGVPPESAAPGG